MAQFNFVNMSIFFKSPAPRIGPGVNVAATGKTIAQLTWKEIPIADQRGFITNYSISYKTRNIEICKANLIADVCISALLSNLFLRIIVQVQ